MQPVNKQLLERCNVGKISIIAQRGHSCVYYLNLKSISRQILTSKEYGMVGRRFVRDTRPS